MFFLITVFVCIVYRYAGHRECIVLNIYLFIRYLFASVLLYFRGIGTSYFCTHIDGCCIYTTKIFLQYTDQISNFSAGQCITVYGSTRRENNSQFMALEPFYVCFILYLFIDLFICA